MSNEPVRIVHVASGLRTGGAEMSLLRLLQNLDRESFPPLVVSLRAGGTVAEKIRAIGIELIEIEGSTVSDSLRNWRGAATRVMRFKPAIIHGWMYDGNLAATWMHRRMRKQSRLAWNVRSSIDRLADHALRLQCSIRLNALYSRRPDVVVFNSHVAVDQHARLGFKAKKVAVISNGLDLAKYPAPQPEGRERIRQQLGVPLEVPVISLVARFHPMKDHANFLEAAASLKDTNAMFLLIGPGVVRLSRGLRRSSRVSISTAGCFVLGSGMMFRICSRPPICFASLLPGGKDAQTRWRKEWRADSHAS